LAISSIAAQ